jgi:flagellar biosynthesis/type III secretory pathway ATPase
MMVDTHDKGFRRLRVLLPSVIAQLPRLLARAGVTLESTDEDLVTALMRFTDLLLQLHQAI